MLPTAKSQLQASTGKKELYNNNNYYNAVIYVFMFLFMCLLYNPKANCEVGMSKIKKQNKHTQTAKPSNFCHSNSNKN
jgi:hypothetical protein